MMCSAATPYKLQTAVGGRQGMTIIEGGSEWGYFDYKRGVSDEAIRSCLATSSIEILRSGRAVEYPST